MSSESPIDLALWLGLVVAIVFMLWRVALPQPLPGIPYNPVSSKRFLGDFPDARSSMATAGGFLAFLGSRCELLGSPIVQVFMKPMSRPFIVVRDSRECYDILNRRLQDFDQSDFFRAQLTAVWPNSSVTFPTNDKWKYNRRLTSEIMSPAFLRDVAAPILAKQTILLADIWSRKNILSEGRPFDVEMDMPMVFNDIIWMTIFGTDVGAAQGYVDDLTALKSAELPTSKDKPSVLPAARLPELFTAFKAIVDSGDISRESPLGRWHHEFAFRFYPKLSRAWRLKNKLVRDSCARAWAKYSTSQRELGQRVGSAVEFVIQREVKQAKREGREAIKPSKYLEGELAMMLGAGFETTSASMKWVIKYLTAFPDVQERVREELREAFPEALDEKRDPSPTEMYNARLTYMDAFVEEVLRHSHLLPAATRTSIRETQILGHHIPKGTTVIMMLSPEHNPTFESSSKSQPTHVKESVRTETSKEYKSSSEKWDADDLHAFNPDRYLTANKETGLQDFDPMAGPMLTFGGGIRACFGKKLAYLNMRVMIAYVVWRFEFLPVPEEFGTFKLREANVVVPEQVYLRLKPIKL